MRTIRLDIPDDVTAEVTLFGSRLSLGRFQELVEQYGAEVSYQCLRQKVDDGPWQTLTCAKWDVAGQRVMFHGPPDPATAGSIA